MTTRMVGATNAAAALLSALLFGTQVAAQDEDNSDLYSDGDPALRDGPRSGPTSVPEPLTVYGGIRIGAGGSAAFDPGDSEDMTTTFGLQAGADYVAMRYFAIGGELRMARFNTSAHDEAGAGRSLLFDLVARPRGRYALPGLPLELFGALPIGLAIPSLNDDVSADGKVGVTLGFGAGANYFLTDRIGLGGELVYLKHWIGWDSNVVAGPAGATNYRVSLGQVNFMANFIYAL